MRPYGQLLLLSQVFHGYENPCKLFGSRDVQVKFLQDLPQAVQRLRN